MKHLVVIASLALVCAACSNESDDAKILNASPSSVTFDSYLDTAAVAVSRSDCHLASVTLQGVKFLVDENLSDADFETNIGWLGITKTDGTLQLSSWVNPSYDDLRIIVEANTTGQNRSFEICLVYMSCANYIYGYQSGV